MYNDSLLYISDAIVVLSIAYFPISCFAVLVAMIVRWDIPPKLNANCSMTFSLSLRTTLMPAFTMAMSSSLRCDCLYPHIYSFCNHIRTTARIIHSPRLACSRPSSRWWRGTPWPDIKTNPRTGHINKLSMVVIYGIDFWSHWENDAFKKKKCIHKKCFEVQKCFLRRGFFDFKICDGVFFVRVCMTGIMRHTYKFVNRWMNTLNELRLKRSLQMMKNYYYVSCWPNNAVQQERMTWGENDWGRSLWSLETLFCWHNYLSCEWNEDVEENLVWFHPKFYGSLGRTLHPWQWYVVFCLKKDQINQ